ncbi:MAG: hypothetical protein GY842_03525 [bacterium]|nr:hypothetical protein [bacterium]
MLRHRKILLGLTVVTVVGSLGATIAYAMYLRSPGFRESIAADLSDLLGLEVALRKVVPRSFVGRQFEGITVCLPAGDTRIAELERAVWREHPDSQDEKYALDISDGWLLVGTGHWTPQDYEQLLRSGFGHDFNRLRLAQVNVERIDFRWRHANFAMTAPAADGVIYFDDSGQGRAVLSVNQLNDIAVDDPIHVSAWFTPGAGMMFQKVELRVGDIPLGALGLDLLLGNPVDSGVFSGRITYRDVSAGQWAMEVGGSLHGGLLEQLTRQVIGGPFRGVVDVNIEQACFGPGNGRRPELTALRFGGRIAELQLADLASIFREPALNGGVELTVHQAEIEGRDLRYVRVSGQARDVSLDALTRLLGYGVVTGQLEVRINTLAIVDNEIQFADVQLTAHPPTDGPAYIERKALATVGRTVFGLDLSRVLPERIEYVQMGAKLLLDREGLRIRGTHGEDGKTILTVNLFGREVGILRQPERIYPVEDLLTLLRTHLKQYDTSDLVDWWTKRGEAPAAESSP